MIPSTAFMIRRFVDGEPPNRYLTYSYSYLSCCPAALESFTLVGSKEGIPDNDDDDEP